MTTPPTLIAPHEAVGLLDPLTAIAAEAGRAILNVHRPTMTIAGKADLSPVTAADHAADDVIASALARRWPNIPVLSEERSEPVPGGYPHSFFLIDPLDGTREYIEGRDEYTVNIALVTQGRSILGVVGAPALGTIWRGVAGYGAQRLCIDPDNEIGPPEPIATRHGPPRVFAISRSHRDRFTDGFIDLFPGAERLVCGSALKFCRIAEGSADVTEAIGADGRPVVTITADQGYYDEWQDTGIAGRPLAGMRSRRWRR